MGGRPKPILTRRLPAGTPPLAKGDPNQRLKDKKASQNKLAEMLRSDEMKQWLRSRLIEPGVLNMSVSAKHLPEIRKTYVTSYYKTTPG
jgi:hypothetical protein